MATKDADFVQSFLLQDRPYKLLLVSTGNISNDNLLTLFEDKLNQIVEGFDTVGFVELTREFLILHGADDTR